MDKNNIHDLLREKLSDDVLNFLKNTVDDYFFNSAKNVYARIPISSDINAGDVSICPYFEKDNGKVVFYYSVNCSNGKFKCPSDFLLSNRPEVNINTAMSGASRLSLSKQDLLNPYWKDDFRKKVADFILYSEDVINYIQYITKYFKNYTFTDNSVAEETFSEFDWKLASEFSKINDAVIKRFADRLDWMIIACEQQLDEDFIEKYSRYMDWTAISASQELSEIFIERHEKDIDWEMISLSQELSFSFMEKYADRLNWDYLARSQCMDDAFIEKHFEKFSKDGLKCVSRYQNISSAFIFNHGKDLDAKSILENQNISDALKAYVRNIYYSIAPSKQKKM